ncbi:LCP family protein [Kitasatospora cheerisanensis]|uniref:Putative lytR family regulatory protein n=1 Tax=Kitasatospora cheerisanensis KCTC 2395 TaxID=1348663 RepID=A0A066YSB5_9ACTN|nr:LCP family protein [Kitasatospora cheerisanensis]KDN84448.1 putative lytR family regulatory protein [Kitasatospora cheerisanensis KCTC 2395]
MDDGDGEFEVQLGAAFGQAGGGPGPEVTARLVDGGLAIGRRRRARRRRAVLLASALTAAVVVGAGALTVPHGVPGQRSDVLDAAHSASPPPPQPLEKGVTVLLVGLDSTVDAKGRPAPPELVHGDLHAAVLERNTTDTLMLVRIPAGGGEVRQLSIPRDVLVPDGHGGQVTINSVYPTAETAERDRLRQEGLPESELLERGRGAGRIALLRAVEQLSEVPVDHYAELSMAGFYRAAQALGGVPVCLNRPARDDWSGTDLPAGRQELDPAQALAFVRQRHGVGDGSDIQRTVRAQALLAGVVAKLRSGGLLSDPQRLGRLYDALSDQLVVDQGWSPVDFLRQVPALAAGGGTAVTLPVTLDGIRPRAVPGAAKQLLTGPAPTAAVSSAPLGERRPGATVTLQPAPLVWDGVPCVN